MPKRTDIESILIIGAGPIVIGQACEFDYSGAQACKALREEGYRVILVNSNPATIMTAPDMADAVYIEPVQWQTVAKIIEKERPDAVLPTMGGQTALNCALDLAKHGVLEQFDVELIGASRDAIDMAEDRERFRIAMGEIGLATPRAAIAHSIEEALQVQAQIGFPTIIRPSFTLGGSGGVARPISPIAMRKRSRSSAISMASREAPISSTSNCSSTPCLARSSAQLSAVWPPMVGSTASGRSFSMILATVCHCTGSMLTAPAMPGSVISVAGFESTWMTL